MKDLRPQAAVQISIFSIIGTFFGLVFVRIAFAAETFPVAAIGKKYNFPDPLGGVSVSQLIGRIISQVLPFVGALFLLMFMWGGLEWMTAGGDSAKVQKAIKTLRNSVIGIIIVLGAYVIVQALVSYGSTILK